LLVRFAPLTFLVEGSFKMTVSMRVMTAGDGYKYLLKSVAAGDGDRSLSTPWESKRTYVS
jgi:hypothetical protein